MRRFRTFWLAVALLGFVWVADGQTNDPPYPLDDFLCYWVQSTILNVPVGLKDDIAFTASTPTDVTVQTARDLCNAAELAMGKHRTAIDNPTDDLTFYDFVESLPGNLMTAQVNNFFGPQTIEILHPTHLAVPTGKSPAQASTNMDSFVCYEANGASIRKRLAATDLWMRERVVVAFPYLFCNPVEITQDSVATPIKHPDDHLVCYEIAEQTFAPDPTVVVDNRFNEPPNYQTLSVQSLNLLCVPTTVSAPVQVVGE
jgi:hypothetical protein